MKPTINYMRVITICVLMLLCGCNPVTRHMVLTTVFDGVPSLPPPEQICQEYADKKVNELRDELTGRKADNDKPTGDKSHHKPYENKECNKCHDKTTESGFVTPKKDLCYVCHTGFIKGAYVHGPVAALDCLFCHEPHTSRYPFLLKKDVGMMCTTCHREDRMALSLHKKMAASKIECTECHNPHFGNVPYFLK